MQTHASGYNDEEIRVFIPKKLREMIMRENSEEDFTHYEDTLSRYFATIDQKEMTRITFMSYSFFIFILVIKWLYKGFLKVREIFKWNKIH